MEYKITALKAQKRDPNRVNVYLNDKFAFGVARIVAAWLRVGQLIDDKKIDELKSQDEYEKAFQKAVQYLSYRPRTEQEVRKKLTDQEFPEELINAVLERLNKLELVCDENYARFWIENRSEFRPRSHRLLSLELIRKGVSSETIDEALEDAEDEESLAYKAAVKYVHRLEGLDWNDFRKKLSGFLGRRGFAYYIIAPVVRQVWEETRSVESISLNGRRG